MGRRTQVPGSRETRSPGQATAPAFARVGTGRGRRGRGGPAATRDAEAVLRAGPWSRAARLLRKGGRPSPRVRRPPLASDVCGLFCVSARPPSMYAGFFCCPERRTTARPLSCSTRHGASRSRTPARRARPRRSQPTHYDRRRSRACQRLLAARVIREGHPHLDGLAVVGCLECVCGTHRPIDLGVPVG